MEMTAGVAEQKTVCRGGLWCAILRSLAAMLGVTAKSHEIECSFLLGLTNMGAGGSQFRNEGAEVHELFQPAQFSEKLMNDNASRPTENWYVPWSAARHWDYFFLPAACLSVAACCFFWLDAVVFDCF
jgi:hypothetical protein